MKYIRRKKELLPVIVKQEKNFAGGKRDAEAESHLRKTFWLFTHILRSLIIPNEKQQSSKNVCTREGSAKYGTGQDKGIFIYNTNFSLKRKLLQLPIKHGKDVTEVEKYSTMSHLYGYFKNNFELAEEIERLRLYYKQNISSVMETLLSETPILNSLAELLLNDLSNRPKEERYELLKESGMVKAIERLQTIVKENKVIKSIAMEDQTENDNKTEIRSDKKGISSEADLKQRKLLGCQQKPSESHESYDAKISKYRSFYGSSGESLTFCSLIKEKIKMYHNFNNKDPPPHCRRLLIYHSVNGANSAIRLATRLRKFNFIVFADCELDNIYNSDAFEYRKNAFKWADCVLIADTNHWWENAKGRKKDNFLTYQFNLIQSNYMWYHCYNFKVISLIDGQGSNEFTCNSPELGCPFNIINGEQNLVKTIYRFVRVCKDGISIVDRKN